MTNNKQLVFIDESGDPGLIGARSSHFIIAAVVIVNETEDLLIRAKIRGFRRSLGWRDEDEFKFSKTRKVIVRQLIGLLAPYDFRIYGIVLDKDQWTGSHGMDNRYSLYNRILADLLKGINIPPAKICIDGNAGKKYQKNTAAFLRRELDGRMKITGLKYEDSRKVDELQLADIAAGAINRSLSKGGDSGDYIELLKGKIVEIYKL